MTNLHTQVTWFDARESLPWDGAPVAAAITGPHPVDTEKVPVEDFWLVRPMVFIRQHWSEDGTEHSNCFVDSDGIVRLPYGLAEDESVTHWAELPTLPGMTTHLLTGEDVQPALQSVLNARPAT